MKNAITTFQVHRASKAKALAPKEKSFWESLKSKRGLALLLLLLLFFWLVGWAITAAVRHRRSQAQIKKALDLLETANTEEGRANWEEIRKTLRELKPRQNRELTRIREEKQNVEYRRFVQMSREEKNQYLDAQIQKENERARQRQERMAALDGGQGGPGGGPGGGRRGQGQGAPGQQGQGQQGQGGGPGGNGPGGNGPGSGQSRDDRARIRLDFSTPESRALRYEMRNEMAQRRAALGLPPSTGRGFGGFGGGFGGPGGAAVGGLPPAARGVQAGAGADPSAGVPPTP